LVVEQFRIAQGLPVSVTTTPEPRGHAIEFRINMEDPGRGFLPAAGEIIEFVAPSGLGVRLDTGVVTGSAIPPMFDSLSAKLIVWGADRTQAIARARRALSEFEIEGVPSVLPFHRAVVRHSDFTDDFRVHTRWIENDFAETLDDAARPHQMASRTMLRGHIEVDGRRVQVGIPDAFLRLLGPLSREGEAAGVNSDAEQDDGAVKVAVSGMLVQWNVADGAQVEKGDVLAVMDVMKMETSMTASVAGIVTILAEAGSMQSAGSVIARITQPSAIRL
jgi:acetyl-CoA/propionyl-CoA carboxylase biotin carboxyl carrier protein